MPHPHNTTPSADEALESPTAFLQKAQAYTRDPNHIAALKDVLEDFNIVELIMVITPEVAQWMLKRNTKNRNLKPKQVEKHVRNLRDGHWLYYIGAMISFDINGVLVDGQHRLHAIVKSGVAAVCRVQFNLPDDAYKWPDDGALRTAGDVLTMHGYKNGRFLAGAANALNRWRQKGYVHANSSNAGNVTLAFHEIVKVVENNPLLLDAYQATIAAQRELRYSHAALAVAWVVFAETTDVDTAKEFFDLVGNLGGGSQPLVALLKRVRQDHEQKRTYTYGTLLYLIFRAWNAWISGEEIHKFPLGTDGKWSPIPAPLKTKK